MVVVGPSVCFLKYRINLTLKPEAHNLQMQFSQNLNSVSLPALNCGHIHMTETWYNVCACCGDTQCSTSDTSQSPHSSAGTKFLSTSFIEKHSVPCVTITASAGSMTTATTFCDSKSGIKECMDAEDRSKEASKQPTKQTSRFVISKNVKLLQYNITHTHSVFQPSQLQRNDVQKCQSWNSDLVPF